MLGTLNTPITTLLRSRTPVICPPMAGASGGLLAAAVTAAGGFGFIGAGYDSSEAFRKQLDLARSHLVEKGFQSSSPLHIGVGFLVWILEESNSHAVELLDIALEARVSAVWFSFGTNLGRWVQYVREFDQTRRGDIPHKTLIFLLVSSVEETQQAINENVDVIVAQGIEAGGHGSSKAPPLLTIVSEILANFPHGPPLVAAGGLANGAHIAALLTLGASAAVLGTRFLLTPESTYLEVQKKVLTQATSTLRTRAFDIARGTLGWPKDINGRALFNQTVKNVEDGMNIDEVRKEYRVAAANQDPNGIVIWAGTGVALMNEVKNAADIVHELHNEIVHSIETAYSLLGPKST